MYPSLHGGGPGPNLGRDGYTAASYRNPEGPGEPHTQLVGATIMAWPTAAARHGNTQPNCITMLTL